YQAGAAQTTFADVLSADQALYAARLTLAETRQALWLAISDLQGLMQLDLDEEFSGRSVRSPWSVAKHHPNAKRSFEPGVPKRSLGTRAITDYGLRTTD